MQYRYVAQVCNRYFAYVIFSPRVVDNTRNKNKCQHIKCSDWEAMERERERMMIIMITAAPFQNSIFLLVDL